MSATPEENSLKFLFPLKYFNYQSTFYIFTEDGSRREVWQIRGKVLIWNRLLQIFTRIGIIPTGVHFFIVLYKIRKKYGLKAKVLQKAGKLCLDL